MQVAKTVRHSCLSVVFFRLSRDGFVIGVAGTVIVLTATAVVMSSFALIRWRIERSGLFMVILSHGAFGIFMSFVFVIFLGESRVTSSRTAGPSGSRPRSFSVGPPPPLIVIFFILFISILMQMTPGDVGLGTRSLVAALTGVMSVDLVLEESHAMASSSGPCLGRGIIAAAHGASHPGRRRGWLGGDNLEMAITSRFNVLHDLDVSVVGVPDGSTRAVASCDIIRDHLVTRVSRRCTLVVVPGTLVVAAISVVITSGSIGIDDIDSVTPSLGPQYLKLGSWVVGDNHHGIGGAFDICICVSVSPNLVLSLGQGPRVRSWFWWTKISIVVSLLAAIWPFIAATRLQVLIVLTWASSRGVVIDQLRPAASSIRVDDPVVTIVSKRHDSGTMVEFTCVGGTTTRQRFRVSNGVLGR